MKVRKKEMEVIPLLFLAICYTLTRAWCAAKLGAISYMARNRIIQKIISTIDEKRSFIGCNGLYSISKSMEVSQLCRC